MKKFKRMSLLFSIVLIFLPAGCGLDKVDDLSDNDAASDYILVGKKQVLYTNLAEDPDSWDRVCLILNKNKEYEESYNNEVYNNIKQTSGILCLEKEKIRYLNEEIYLAEIDLDANKAILNEEEVVDAKEYFNLTENDQIEELSESLGDIVTGDVEVKGGMIEVNNPYKTNSIFVETKDLQGIKNIGNVKYITKLANNTYSIEYYNAIDTKKAYDDLSGNESIIVSKDRIFKID